MNQNNNPFQAPVRKKTPTPNHANFIEALKSVGGQTAQSIKHDVIGGVANDFVQSITGNGPNQPRQEQLGNREQKLSPEDQIHQEIIRAQRHREVVETSLFDRRREEAKMRIKVIQEELQALAKELGGFDLQLQKAVEEEIVNPGTYHQNFFEKVRKLVIVMRQRVQESASWLATMTERGAKQQGYWGQVQQSGTKFMLSQERYMATQAG